MRPILLVARSMAATSGGLSPHAAVNLPSWARRAGVAPVSCVASHCMVVVPTGTFALADNIHVVTNYIVPPGNDAAKLRAR